MSKVTIYQYQMLNTNLGEPRKARRWGTREAIEGLKGSAEIIEFAVALVDASPSIRWGSRVWTLTHHQVDGSAVDNRRHSLIELGLLT
jgi:hypothetical protein